MNSSRKEPEIVLGFQPHLSPAMLTKTSATGLRWTIRVAFVPRFPVDLLPGISQESLDYCPHSSQHRALFHRNGMVMIFVHPLWFSFWFFWFFSAVVCWLFYVFLQSRVKLSLRAVRLFEVKLFGSPQNPRVVLMCPSLLFFFIFPLPFFFVFSFHFVFLSLRISGLVGWLVSTS